MTGAELKENLVVALETIRSRKVRALLTILGIVIGVSSVIAVAAIIEGLNNMVQQRVSDIGSRTYFISRFPFALDPNRLPQEVRIRPYLVPTDGPFLEESAPSIEFATPFANRPSFTEQNPAALSPNELRYGNEQVTNVFIRGVEPEHTDAVPLFTVRSGRFITEDDLSRSRRVVVIGLAIAESLFPFTDPIGKSVRVNGKVYEVIGVFERDPGLFGGPGIDQIACIPFTTFRKEYPEIREILVAFSIRADVSVPYALNEVTEAMRRRRNVPHRAENNFEVISPDFLNNLWEDLTGALFILTAIISSVGLMVGGVGVMNIMLISVTERTKEIGIRKAIGARRSDIRMQFLFEAVLLTVVGGILGIAFGAAAAWVIRTVAPTIPATVSLLWVALGVGMSAAVGVFFGFYPANRAAYLDPIVCLRYE